MVDVISEDFLYLLEFLFLMEILQNCLKFFLAVLGNEKGHGLDGVDFFSETVTRELNSNAFQRDAAVLYFNLTQIKQGT